MAFQQYNSAALKERRRRQQEYEEYLAKKMSEEEDKRQKKYGFMLEPPNVIPNYMDAPAKKGEGNLGVDTIREGKIFTPEPTGDDRMSPALRDVFFRPIEVAPINPRDVMKRRTRKKHSPRSAKYYKEGRAKTSKIYGNKNKEKPKKVKRSKSAPRGGRRKRRKQRGGNTSNCETAQLSYNDLANKIEKILEVKVPNWWHMTDGPYKLVEYNVEDSDAAEMGQPGIFGIGLETPDGHNGFFIPKSDIEDETVRLCAPHVDNDTAPAGGRRKKRRKTRKNKRSKKRRGKKRKTRKRRKKRR